MKKHIDRIIDELLPEIETATIKNNMNRLTVALTEGLRQVVELAKEIEAKISQLEGGQNGVAATEAPVEDDNGAETEVAAKPAKKPAKKVVEKPAVKKTAAKVVEKPAAKKTTKPKTAE